MTTINLRKDLEALYYFGEQDFNPQRNQLQDHSGYGRHAEADASITFGDNGVTDFESGNFRGGSIYPFIIDNKDGFTNAFLSKFDSQMANGNNYGGIGRNDFDEGIEYKINNEGISFGMKSFREFITRPIQTEEYIWTIGRYDGEYMTFHHGDFSQTRLVGSNHELKDSGVDGWNYSFIADVAICLNYSRALSQAEINRLKDLTAPVRAQL